MITAPFAYEAPAGLDEAVRILRQHGEDAKLLAGGHSLLPLMKLRLAAPALLVDLRKVPGLAGIQPGGATVRVGSMTRHHAVASEPELGLAAKAAATIADQQVRNRGTIGGTLAHGDPASDLPAVLLALEGSVVARGEHGEREIAAGDLFQDYLTTALADGEIVTEVRLPSAAGWGAGYAKFNRRVEDWAMVAVCAAVRRAPDGSCEDVRIGLTNMAGVPLRATASEQTLRGGSLDSSAIAAAAEHAAEGTDPPADLNASSDYKRHLARVLCKRTLQEAAAAA